MKGRFEKAAAHGTPLHHRSLGTHIDRLPFIMTLGDDILKKINGRFEPAAKIALRYRSYDLVLVTDKEGNAVQLFMGKANADGVVKGNRYARTLKYDRDGRLIKDHWERKGKAS